MSLRQAGPVNDELFMTTQESILGQPGLVIMKFDLLVIILMITRVSNNFLSSRPANLTKTCP